MSVCSFTVLGYTSSRLSLNLLKDYGLIVLGESKVNSFKISPTMVLSVLCSLLNYGELFFMCIISLRRSRIESYIIGLLGLVRCSFSASRCKSLSKTLSL